MPALLVSCARSSWAGQGLNLRHPVCKTSALPLSYPPGGHALLRRAGAQRQASRRRTAPESREPRPPRASLFRSPRRSRSPHGTRDVRRAVARRAKACSGRTTAANNPRHCRNDRRSPPQGWCRRAAPSIHTSRPSLDASILPRSAQSRRLRPPSRYTQLKSALRRMASGFRRTLFNSPHPASQVALPHPAHAHAGRTIDHSSSFSACFGPVTPIVVLLYPERLFSCGADGPLCYVPPAASGR